MCNWLGVDLVLEDHTPHWDLWIPNHNKIPLEGSATYAKELFNREEARAHFHLNLGQGMLRASWPYGGYITNMAYFRDWERYWNSKTHPARALCS